MAETYTCHLLTGGVSGSLDNIDGAGLSVGDNAQVIRGDADDDVLHYTVKDSGAAESIPDVIAPDTNPGTLRWHRVDTNDDHTHVEADISDLDHDDVDAIHDNVAGEINAIAEKAAPADNDVLVIEDSEAGYAKKKVLKSNIGGAGGGLPSGTIILIESDTAITGFTLLTDKDDYLAFITKGSAAGGKEGGTDHDTGTWTIGGLTNNSENAHQHSIPVLYLQYGSSFANMQIVADGDISADSVDYEMVSNSPTKGTYTGRTVYEDIKMRTSASTSGVGAAHTHTISSDATWRPKARCFTRQQKT